MNSDMQEPPALCMHIGIEYAYAMLMPMLFGMHYAYARSRPLLPQREWGGGLAVPLT